MRILITGGAGFIRQAVVAELASGQVNQPLASTDHLVVLDSLRADVHAAGHRLVISSRGWVPS